jgi:hypothetical protein
MVVYTYKPALRMLRPEDHEFKAFLSNILRPYLKNKPNKPLNYETPRRIHKRH